MIADPHRFRLDAKTVTAGMLLPAVCFAVDYAIGQHITGGAPAGFLTLYVLGGIALALPAFLNPHSKVWAVAAGALAAAALAVCVIALAISLLSAVVARIGVDTVGTKPLLFSSGPRGFEALALSVLGLSTLYTAWVFVRRAYSAVRTGVGIQGHQTVGLGLLGAILLAVSVYGADQLDRWWVTSQAAQISRTNQADWPQILADLSAYPLCGPERCAKLVCNRFFLEFGGLALPDNVAAQQKQALHKCFRGPPSHRCQTLSGD